MITRTMKEYRASDLPKDALAGLVIAALSIPIAMGYAELVGLPAIYGLWASVVAPLAFALLTGTRRVVFGMDSAAAAMTASMLAAVGIAGQDAIVAAMPLLTLFTAVFLLLLSWARAGRLIRLMPLPVMHGFIFGIAITVVVGQVPLLLGTTANTSGSIAEKVTAIAACLPDASLACAVVSALCIAGMYLLKRFLPKVPAAIVVLVVAAVVCNSLEAAGVFIVFLPNVSSSLPQIPTALPAEIDVAALLLAAFVIAVVVALESLLCIEAFCSGDAPAPSPDAEMCAFGLANALTGLLGCPPCSASMSRSAAGIASGSRSQVASMVAAVVVAVVALAAGSFMDLLPRCALSAIVVVALLDIVDFEKIAIYARKTRREFMVFAISAALVILFGAVAGILGGVILSLALRAGRDKIGTSGPELLGAVPYKPDDLPAKKDIRVGYKLGIVKLSGDLSFVNIGSAVEEIDAASTGKEALILKLSKLDTIDTTAADKLTETLDSLMERGVHVKLVRPIKETTDHYTRVELRQLMRSFKFYPSVRTAMHSLAEEYAAGMEPQRPDTWLACDQDELGQAEDAANEVLIEGDRPVVSIAGLRNRSGDVVDSDGTPFLEDIHGKLSFLQSHRTFHFSATFLEDSRRAREQNNGHYFSKLLVWDESTGKVELDYRNATMRTCRNQAIADALMEPIDRTIRDFALAQ